MSSISTYRGKSGDTLRAVQFIGSDKKRRSIRLGTLPAKDVEDIKGRIDVLEIYRKYGRQHDPDTIKWLATLDNGVYDTLAAGGLVTPRSEKQKGLALGAYLEHYIGQRQALVTAGKLKEDSLRKEKQTQHCLIDHFGADKPVAEFTYADSEDFRHYCLVKGSHSVKRCGSAIVILARRPLSENTTRKHCSTASKFFKAAQRRKLIDCNPFDNEAVPKSVLASEHHAYITEADSKAVLDKLPTTEWRLLFALLRWGALRIHEPRLLTWADVLWDTNRLIVHSTKTGTRQSPIWPEVLKLLEERYDEAPEGVERVLPFMQGRTDASLRKPLQKAITAAGVPSWRRLFHNLRYTRQNELLEAGHPRKAVCYWVGNSEDVADKNYEDITAADWERATGVRAPDNAPPAENAKESSRKR